MLPLWLCCLGWLHHSPHFPRSAPAPNWGCEQWGISLSRRSKIFLCNIPWRRRGGVEVRLYSFFNLGARLGQVVNVTPPLPDCPACCDLLYGLHYPGHQWVWVVLLLLFYFLYLLVIILLFELPHFSNTFQWLCFVYCMKGSNFFLLSAFLYINVIKCPSFGFLKIWIPRLIACTFATADVCNVLIIFNDQLGRNICNLIFRSDLDGLMKPK